jgi:hypothetical protein
MSSSFALGRDSHLIGRSGAMEFIKQILVATGSSLLTAFILWLVSRYRPIADWIMNHRITSALIGIVFIYLAGFSTVIYMSSMLRQQLAVWSPNPSVSPGETMSCPANTYVTAVSLPVINNGGFVGRGTVTCRPLNVTP